MNHNTNTKKLNNNGFSLVELIIVVAIMAVLVGVLAPQYLQYVEKSRYQTDITMIDEIKGAIEIAIATDEDLYNKVAKTYVTINTTDNTVNIDGDADMKAEVIKVIDVDSCKLTSKTCIDAATNIKIYTDSKKNVYMDVPSAANEPTDIITK